MKASTFSSKSFLNRLWISVCSRRYSPTKQRGRRGRRNRETAPRRAVLSMLVVEDARVVEGELLQRLLEVAVLVVKVEDGAQQVLVGAAEAALGVAAEVREVNAAAALDAGGVGVEADAAAVRAVVRRALFDVCALVVHRGRRRAGR